MSSNYLKLDVCSLTAECWIVMRLWCYDGIKRTANIMKQDRRCTYKRNIEAHSRNHCCLGKAISIIYSECVFVALVYQHAKRNAVLYCHLWPVRLYDIFPSYVIKGTIFRNKINYWTWNVCFDFFYSFRLQRISFYEEFSEILSKMYIGPHVKYPLFLSDFNETRIFSTHFRKMFK
jgi:hypothetical protein